MMLDSEMCVQVKDEKTGKLVGCSFNNYWPVENDYNAFEVDPKDWLNTAAEIAEVSRAYRYHAPLHTQIGRIQKALIFYVRLSRNFLLLPM